MKEILSKIKQELYHGCGIYPIYEVIKAINTRLPLTGCDALEAFAHTGAWQARAYRKYPKYLEAWEINAWCRPFLEKNLPGAVIKITNSFEEVLTCNRKFDFINVDTHQGLFGEYCENFEFFPLLFGVAKDECMVNLNVMPSASEQWLRKYPTLFNEEHLARRKAFYKTASPANVSIAEMLTIYGAIAAEHNYRIVWHYYKQRTLTYYLVLHLKKE